MVLTSNKQIIQKSLVRKKVSYEKLDTKNLFITYLKNKNEYCDNIIKSDGTFDINKISNLTLHGFLLEAEEQGLNIEFQTTKTIIIS